MRKWNSPHPLWSIFAAVNTDSDDVIRSSHCIYTADGNWGVSEWVNFLTFEVNHISAVHKFMANFPNDWLPTRLWLFHYSTLTISLESYVAMCVCLDHQAVRSPDVLAYRWIQTTVIQGLRTYLNIILRVMSAVLSKISSIGFFNERTLELRAVKEASSDILPKQCMPTNHVWASTWSMWLPCQLDPWKSRKEDNLPMSDRAMQLRRLDSRQLDTAISISSQNN